jgi:hypothetical protein
VAAKRRLLQRQPLIYSAANGQFRMIRGTQSMAKSPTNFKRGSMNIREHEATFAMFWSLTKFSIIGVILLMVLLAYLFV